MLYQTITTIVYRRLGRLLVLAVILGGTLGLGVAGLSAAAGLVGSVAAYTKIAADSGGLPPDALQNGDNFGWSVTTLGDLNQDGAPDLAVGAPNDNTEGSDRGAVYLLLIKPDNTVLTTAKIAAKTGGFTLPLSNNDNFGTAVTAVGGPNQDGAPNLVVGAPGDDTRRNNNRGAIYLLSLKPDNTVLSSTKIADNTGGLPLDTLENEDNFGTAVTTIGDLNQDGVPDLAVGAPGDDTGGDRRGAVYLLLMKSDNTVLSYTKIADGLGGLPPDTLTDQDVFGTAVTTAGDLNQDGVPDLVVGAPGDSGIPGMVYLLFLKSDNTVLSHTKIANDFGGLPPDTLSPVDKFGTAVTAVGDLNQDGIPDLAVGAPGDDPGSSSNSGAVYLLLMKSDDTVLSYTKIAANTGGLPPDASKDNDNFGTAVTAMGDLNQDGIPDLTAGAPTAGVPIDDTEDDNTGAIYMLLLKGTTLDLAKTVDDAHPRPGQQATYTLTITNRGALTATNAVISDSLPAGLTIAGPVSLDPPDAGSPGTAPPILADGLTIAPGGTVAVSFPVLVNSTLPSGTLIINTALVTSAEVTIPATGAISLTTGPHFLYLPAILKSSQS